MPPSQQQPEEAQMTQYPDHPRIAQKLLDQQGDINRLTAERDALRQQLDAAHRRFDALDATAFATEPALTKFTAAYVTPEMERAATERTRQAAEGHERAAEWFAKHSGPHPAEAERDGAYRERAQLLALLASLHPSVIAPAPDIDEDGWQILYLRIGGKQASWHIAPRDADLYTHVEHVPADDSRAQWDGHTTEQKYAHIGRHAAQLYAEARSRAETPSGEQYRYATTWAEYHAGRRAAVAEPEEH